MSETLFVLLGVLKADSGLKKKLVLYQGVDLASSDLFELELLSLTMACGHLVRGCSCV